MDQPSQEFAPEDQYLPDPFPPGYTDADMEDDNLTCSGLL